jgi:DNA-binding response OmpR family regulator
MILDIMLPDLDGFEVIKQADKIPTIFLTAKNSLPDSIKGFSMGADDYLTKPFEMLELLARVEAVLRRTQKTASCFEAGNVKINFDSHQVFHNGQLVECTPKEYELLEVLVKKPEYRTLQGKAAGAGLGLRFLKETPEPWTYIYRSCGKSWAGKTG